MRQVTGGVLDGIYAEKLAAGDSLCEEFLIWITVGVRHMPRSIEHLDTGECRREFLGRNEASKRASLLLGHDDAYRMELLRTRSIKDTSALTIFDSSTSLSKHVLSERNKQKTDSVDNLDTASCIHDA